MKERFHPPAEPVRRPHATYDNQLYSLYITEIIMCMKRLTEVTSTCTVSVKYTAYLAWIRMWLQCPTYNFLFRKFQSNSRI